MVTGGARRAIRCAAAALLVALAGAGCARHVAPAPVAPPPEPARPVASFRVIPAGASLDGSEWTITSTPPGAAIWIDGVDTGARTPATFGNPGGGKHVIRLALDGHADDTETITTSVGAGLSYGRILRPRAEVDHEDATRRAAARPVDDAARAETRRFLGADLAHAEVTLERSASISLPPVKIAIRGDGAGEVTWTSLSDLKERKAPLRAGAEVVRGLFETLVAQGFATVVGAERPGVPDEVRVRVAVKSASGATLAAEKWADDRHPRLDPVIDAVLRVLAALPADVRGELRM